MLPTFVTQFVPFYERKPFSKKEKEKKEKEQNKKRKIHNSRMNFEKKKKE